MSTTLEQKNMSSSVGLSREKPVTVASYGLQLIDQHRSTHAASGFRRIVLLGEIIADLLTIGTSVIGAYALYYWLALGKHIHYPTHAVVGLALGFAAVMVLMLDRAGAYSRGNSLLRVRETEQVIRVSAQAFLIALAVSFMSNFLLSRWFLVLCLGLVPLSLFAQKSFVYLLVSALHARGYGTERVLIYGAGCTGRRLFSALTRSPRLGLDAVAFVDDDPSKAKTQVFEMGYERRRSATVILGPVTSDLLREHQIDVVIVAIPSVENQTFLRTAEQAFASNVRVSFVPSHFLPSDPWVDYQDVDGVLLASFGKPAAKRAYGVLKRTVDLVFSLSFLILACPILLVVGLLVKLDSGGGALFRQERIGENGEPFRMYKFRTMYSHAARYDYSPREATDPRITRLGKWLRRTSLDELPQLLNVLKGNMSLVGPRPEMPFIVKQYNERHRQRFQVKPGITGLWQLSGDRAFLIHENIEYDLYYIQHRNFFMDLAILLHTSLFAMRGV